MLTFLLPFLIVIKKIALIAVGHKVKIGQVTYKKIHKLF